MKIILNKILVKSIFKDYKMIIGIIGVSSLLFIAAFPGIFTSYDPQEHFTKNQEPSFGRNILHLVNVNDYSLEIESVSIILGKSGTMKYDETTIIKENFELSPNDSISIQFNIINTGQRGDLVLKLKKLNPDESYLAYRFNKDIQKVSVKNDSEDESFEMFQDTDEELFIFEINQLDEEKQSYSADVSFLTIGNESLEYSSSIDTRYFYDVYMAKPVEDRLKGRHLLGTDFQNRDIYARLIYSARPTAFVAVSSMLLALIIGVPLGFFSGYFAGWVERILIRISDVFSAFPRFALIVAIVALWGQELIWITIAIGITGWMAAARFLYSKIKTLMEQDYILAARSTGRVWWRIMTVDLLPNVLPHIIVLGAYGAGYAVLMESSLSYIHLGIAEPEPSWGNMLSLANSTGAGTTGMERMWQVIFPGLSIALVVLSFNFMGDSLKHRFGLLEDE